MCVYFAICIRVSSLIFDFHYKYYRGMCRLTWHECHDGSHHHQQQQQQHHQQQLQTSFISSRWSNRLRTSVILSFYLERYILIWDQNFCADWVARYYTAWSWHICFNIQKRIHNHCGTLYMCCVCALRMLLVIVFLENTHTFNVYAWHVAVSFRAERRCPESEVVAADDARRDMMKSCGTRDTQVRRHFGKYTHCQ